MTLKEYLDNDWTKQTNLGYETCHRYTSVIDKMVKLNIFIIRLIFLTHDAFQKKIVTLSY